MTNVRSVAGIAPLAFALASFAAAPAIAAKLSITPRADHPKAVIEVSGSGFSPGAAVDVYFDTADKLLVLADASGSFAGQKLRIPASALPGTHWITAVGRRHRDHAQKAITVSTEWAQFGFDQRGNRHNPFENVINTANVSTLDVSWSVTAGGFVGSSPAYSNGVVYVGSTYTTDRNYHYGRLYALDSITGATKWMRELDVVSSSPAVHRGRVYVGTSRGDNLSGSISAFDAGTGATLWSVATGPVDSSPAVANGVVYIGSNDYLSRGVAKLYALNADTGAVLWTRTTADTVYSSPAVVDGVVYVGSDNKVFAFKADTGTRLWSTHIGGYIGSASPAVANGLVYMGSNYGKLYALNASDGSIRWTAKTGTAIPSYAVADAVVYVGCDDGKFYALDANTGAVSWTAKTDPIGISPAVANGIVYISSSGNLKALDANTGATLAMATGYFVTPVVADGMGFVGSADGKVYAYALKGGNNAVYRRNASPPAVASLRPDYHLQLTRYANSKW